MSELCTSPVRMCAFRACGVKSSSNKSHICDDLIVVPLGMLTLSGTCASCLLLHGAVAEKNAGAAGIKNCCVICCHFGK
jgi:hypothetical protein